MRLSSQVKGLELSLRLLVIPFCVASIWIAVTNKEDNTDYGNLEFNNFIGLKYMVFISGVCAGYALFAAISSFFTCLFTKPWFFFLTDQVVAYLMVTSMAALVEFVYLAYNGDRLVSWSEACASYANFCTRLKIALSLHIIALFCFLFLALISAYTLFSRFHPPFLPSKHDHPQHQTT